MNELKNWPLQDELIKFKRHKYLLPPNINQTLLTRADFNAGHPGKFPYNCLDW